MILLAGLQAGPRGGRGRERVLKHRMSLRCRKLLLQSIVLSLLRVHIAVHKFAARAFGCMQFRLCRVLLPAAVSADSFAASQLLWTKL